MSRSTSWNPSATTSISLRSAESAADRKSTRLNSSHGYISYAVFCLEKKINIQTGCLIMEGAEVTENIINGVYRPVEAAELFAFTLRVRAVNTDVLTDAEENVRQKLAAEGLM